MCSMETDDRCQEAVLWAATGTGDDGEYTVAAAVEIDVRWREVQEDVLDSRGNTIAIVAKVVVDQDVAIGSQIWLGSIDDVASPPVNLKQVVSMSKIPDIKSLEYRRVLSVRRSSNTLATLT